jgi:hypothetical protein
MEIQYVRHRVLRHDPSGGERHHFIDQRKQCLENMQVRELESFMLAMHCCSLYGNVLDMVRNGNRYFTENSTDGGQKGC